MLLSEILGGEKMQKTVMDASNGNASAGGIRVPSKVLGRDDWHGACDGAEMKEN
jgi:hypothetical protein